MQNFPKSPIFQNLLGGGGTSKFVWVAFLHLWGGDRSPHPTPTQPTLEPCSNNWVKSEPAAVPAPAEAPAPGEGVSTKIPDLSTEHFLGKKCIPLVPSIILPF